MFQGAGRMHPVHRLNESLVGWLVAADLARQRGKGSTDRRSAAFPQWSKQANLSFVCDVSAAARLPSSQVNRASVYPSQPCVPVTVGKEEEQPLHLDAPASCKKRGQESRQEVGKPFHQRIYLGRAFSAGKLIEQFRQRPFRPGNR